MIRWGPAVSVVLHIVLYMALVSGVYLASWHGYHFCYDVFGVVRAAEAPGEDIRFDVAFGEDLWGIADRLEQAGIIQGRNSFYVRARLMDSRRVVLRPGSYVLNDSMTYEQIINQLTVSEGIEQ